MLGHCIRAYSHTPAVAPQRCVSAQTSAPTRLCATSEHRSPVRTRTPRSGQRYAASELTSGAQ